MNEQECELSVATFACSTGVEGHVCVCVCYLGLLNRCVECLSVYHSEGDALWLGRENPANDGPVVAHGDGNGAIAAGLDKKLTGTFAEMKNLIYIQRHRGTTGRHARKQQ